MTRASDAAIERLAERMRLPRSYYGRQAWFTIECDHLQALSDALRAHFGDEVPASMAGYVLPVVVDPIVAAARRICSRLAGMPHFADNAENYASGRYDETDTIQLTIAELRAIAAQGGEA